MNTTLFIFSIIILQCLCWWVGKRSSKNMTDGNDYYLGGRQFSFFPLAMTFFATQVGGGIILGSADEAYRSGWWVLFYPLGQVLGLLGLGAGIGRRLASYSVSTVAQIFEVFYGSARLKKIVSTLSILSLFMILVAQIMASKKFMLSLGVESQLLFCFFWGILILYTAMGGIRAVVATDVIQAAFFICVFIAALIYALFNFSTFQLTDPEPVTFGKMSGWLFMPFLFSFLEQDMAQRCFGAKSPPILSKATVAAGMGALLIAFVPVFFGILGKHLHVNVSNGSSVFMSTISLATNPNLAALVGCAVLAAILSTADSLINAIGSNFSQDFFKSQSLRKMQFLSVLIGLGALLASSYFNRIVPLMIQSYEFAVAALFVPLMAALFQKRKGNLLSAILSCSFGSLAFFLFRFVPPPIPTELAEIALSFLGYWVGELMVLARSQKALRDS